MSRVLALPITAMLLAGVAVPSSATGRAARVGDPYPVLVLPSIADGSPLSIASFRGRVVLLHQFASW